MKQFAKSFAVAFTVSFVFNFLAQYGVAKLLDRLYGEK